MDNFRSPMKTTHVLGNLWLQQGHSSNTSIPLLLYSSSLPFPPHLSDSVQAHVDVSLRWRSTSILNSSLRSYSNSRGEKGRVGCTFNRLKIHLQYISSLKAGERQAIPKDYLGEICNLKTSGLSIRPSMKSAARPTDQLAATWPQLTALEINGFK